MMYGFPFDSTVTGKDPETGLPTLDRAQFSWQLQNYIAQMFSSGILPNIASCFKCSPGTGMQVKVEKGVALVGGCIAISNAVETLSIAPADTLHDRIDTIVLSRSNAREVRAVELKVIEGAAEEKPTSFPPRRDALTNPVGVYDIVIGLVRVRRNAQSITGADITDTRHNAAICGVSAPYSAVDTTGIFDQFQASFNTWFEQVKGQLSTDVAGNLQNQINSVTEKNTWITLHEIPESINEIIISRSFSEFDVVCMDLNIHGMKKTIIMHVNKQDGQYFSDAFGYLHSDGHNRLWIVNFKISGREITEAYAAMQFDNGKWTDATGNMIVTRIYAKKDL